MKQHSKQPQKNIMKVRLKTFNDMVHKPKHKHTRRAQIQEIDWI